MMLYIYIYIYIRITSIAFGSEREPALRPLRHILFQQTLSVAQLQLLLHKVGIAVVHTVLVTESTVRAWSSSGLDLS
jgi:hypothetical protein